MTQSPALSALDHLVLTVADIDATILFYTRVLGMRSEVFVAADGSTRHALTFGRQKINLHQVGAEFEPKADRATSGSADLCFLTETDLDVWQGHLASLEIDVIDGPIDRTGATGPIRSIYVRDPDRNLIEISTPL